MSKIVPHRHAARSAAKLHPAAHAPETREGSDRLPGGHANGLRGGDRRERVLEIVSALELEAQNSQRLAAPAHLESSLDGSRSPAFAHSEPLDRGPATAREDTRDRSVGAVDDQPTRTRYCLYKMMKLVLNSCKIAEDVGMIELDIVQNCHRRPVVHHLRALVEERRVVLVRFDHEVP